MVLDSRLMEQLMGVVFTCHQMFVYSLISFIHSLSSFSFSFLSQLSYAMGYSGYGSCCVAVLEVINTSAIKKHNDSIWTLAEEKHVVTRMLLRFVSTGQPCAVTGEMSLFFTSFQPSLSSIHVFHFVLSFNSCLKGS